MLSNALDYSRYSDQILAAARWAGLTVTAQTADSSALCFESVRLTTTTAALQLIARLAAENVTAAQTAVVDSWLYYVWSSIEVPLAAGEALEFSILEENLKKQAFLTGDKVSVADIRLGVILQDLPALTPALAAYLEKLTQQAWWSGEAPVAGSTLSGLAMHGPAPAVENKLYRRHRIRIKELLGDAQFVNQSVSVAGWARSVRKQGAKLLFVSLNDGSTGTSLQCVLSEDTAGIDDCKSSGGTGASFSFVGKLVPSQGEGQEVELQVLEAKLLGAVYAGNPEGTLVGGMLYPLSKKEHTLEYLRDVAHLRPRGGLHAAAMRIRHAMAYATHHFFHSHGFLYIHTPILTGADCEGAGEQFGITTLLGSDHLATGVELPKKEELQLSKSELKRLAKKKVDPFKPVEEHIPGSVDYQKDFFHQRVNLTVSGQLNVETHACALSDVYTFGPTFRAEYSFTSRHLSEFWMIEPEIAFADLTDDINLAEDYLKYCVQYALENCKDDLDFFENSPHGEKGLKDRLRNVIESPFKVRFVGEMRSSYRKEEGNINGNLSEHSVRRNVYHSIQSAHDCSAAGCVLRISLLHVSTAPLLHGSH